MDANMDMGGSFFNPGPFMPHGGCYLWTQSLIALHAFSDGAIVLAYYAIPFILFRFVQQRKDLKFKWIFLLFAAFVLACGTTHLMEIWNIWHANYWLAGCCKAVTALVSVFTTILLVKLLPTALALPSADALQKAHDQLEIRVRERTAELQQATVQLQAEIAAHKQAEAARRENAQRYQALFENMNEGIAYCRMIFEDGQPKDFVYLAVNEMFGTLTGLTAVAGRRVTEIIPGIRESDPELFEIYGRVAMSGKPEKHERLVVALKMWFSLSVFSPGPGLFAVIFDVITARKQAEVALRESEDKFRQLADGSPQLVWMCRPDGWNIYFNQRWVEYTGLTLEESYGHGWNKPFHPDDQQRAWDAWKLATESGGEHEYDLECRLRQADGSYHWFLIRGVPLRDAANRVIKWFGTCTDIDGQKLAEAALRESELLLRSILETTKEVVFVKDQECRFVYMNPAGYKLSGATPEKLIGRSKADFHPNAAEAAQFMIDDRRVMKSGVAETIEEIISGADGSQHVFLTTKVTRRDSRGNVIGLIGVAHDITERKRTEKAVRENEARFWQLADNINDVFWICSLDFKTIHFVSTAYEQLWGCPVQSLYANPLQWEEAVLLEDRKRVSDVFATLTDQPEISVEYRIARPDGAIRWVNDRGFQVRDAAGKLVRFAGIARDVTERKLAVEALRHSEARFRLLWQQSADGIRLTNAAGMVVMANPAYCRLLGLLPETVEGQPMCNAYLAENRMKIQQDHQANFLARSVNPRVETQVTLWNGETLWLEVSNSFMEHEGEEPLLLGLFRNITERKRTEQKVHESEERYRQLFELESDAIILVDCETRRVVDANQSARRLYGYSQREFLELTTEEISAQPEAARAAAGTEQNGIPLRWHRKKNGEPFAVEISTNLIFHLGRRTDLVTIRDITARQQVMDMLGETTAQLVEAQHIASLGSYVFDVTTGTWTGSEVLDEVFGLTDPGFTRDILGWLKIIHPEDREEMLRYFQDEVLKSRNAFDHTYRIVRLNDQSERWVHGLGKLVLDNHGQVARMVGVIQDITERKRAEQELRASQALYHSLVMHLPIGIFRKDADGRFVLVNSEFCQLKGRKPEDFLGKTPLEVMGGEAAASDPQGLVSKYAGAGEEHHRQIMQTGRSIELDEEFSLPNGEKQFVHVMKFPVLDQDGKVVGSQGVQFNITERMRAEEQMNLQFSAMSAAANAIVITDRHGKIGWVNPAFAKLTGYSAEEAMGKTPRVLKSGQHPPGFYANMWATILTGNVWHGELVNKRKDGRLYTEEMTITPVRGADGQVTHFVAIKLDVTERRQLENRLQQAQKMEAIGTLAGGIAHDFNNILAAMLGYAYLLQQDTQGNPVAQESVEEILKAAERAKELVKQILTFSRQRERKREVVRLDIVVKEAAKFLRASLPAQIKIQLNLAADAPTVLADPTQIYQVAMNLATNALHAMEGRPGQLAIALESFQPDAPFISQHPELKPIHYARLTIADTGHGMDAKTVERIFDPFFTTKPVGKGTGLGLAVVHGIIQSHEASITVESEVGRGTTFSLYFPAHTTGAASLEAADNNTAIGRGQKILLLDDEPALTAVLKRQLVRLNYQVTISNSPREVIGWCRENPAQFDLVITDLTMPEINGLEVARQLRALRPDLPVILCSGFSADLNRENLQAAGICELLEKPISMTALAEVVQRRLTGTG